MSQYITNSNKIGKNMQLMRPTTCCAIFCGTSDSVLWYTMWFWRKKMPPFRISIFWPYYPLIRVGLLKGPWKSRFFVSSGLLTSLIDLNIERVLQLKIFSLHFQIYQTSMNQWGPVNRLATHLDPKSADFLGPIHFFWLQTSLVRKS